jgi:molybdopterin molybdotransferase
VTTVDAHLAEVLTGIEPLHALDVPLLDAQGCVLAEDVVADANIPRFDQATVDGYAVRLADVATASPNAPVDLPVVGDVELGRAPVVSVQPGFAARVMAGAPVPSGTEAVVASSSTDAGVARVQIRRAPLPGEGIARTGEQVGAGDVLMSAGDLLGPGHLGLLAGIGRARATVRPRPRVVILSTGDQLVEPGTRPEAGQVYEANSYVLTAQAKDAGALTFRVGILPDDPRRLVDAIEDQLVRADLVVTSGGTSERAYAVVRDVLTGIGTVNFGELAMDPGAYQGHGVIGPDSTPLFTLPGDPLGSYVSFEVFVRPVIRRMLGVEPISRGIVRAVCLTPVSSAEGRRGYLRGRLDVEQGRYVVRVVGAPGGLAGHSSTGPSDAGASSAAGISGTNCLVVIPESTTHVAEGDAVEVMVLVR